MDEKTRMALLAPVLGFLVAAAFGGGLIAMAALGDGSTPAAASTAAGGEVIEVELGELFIKPDSFSATAGDITFEVTNSGAAEHNFSVKGLGATEFLGAGEKATLTLRDVPAGTYEVICEVAGHAAGGMTGSLTVGDGGGQDPGANDGPAMTPEEMAAMDAEVTGSFPAETKGSGGKTLEPKIDADGTKEYELTAAPIEWETEPGKVVQGFAYNGMIPGPTLRPELGDRVRIIVNNELPEPTTMHLHGMIVPNEMDGVPVINQDPIMPGESFTYEFTVRNTGTNMYHSHFNSAQQVPMGLLGALVVPAEGDPVADVDFNMVLNDGPLGYTINGKGFPATQPVVAKQGETVRIRYMNEGLQIHPMHLHGMPQLVIAKDGHLLKTPRMEDTVLVAPGERIDVLVEATEPGVWAYHCHILTHAEGEHGMFGMVTAMIVE